MNTEIEYNLNKIYAALENVAGRSGRDPRHIKLIAVSKTVEVDRIRQLIDAGVYALGENRVQEMLSKLPHLPNNIEWHMIGHLQTNKVKDIINKVSLIHSLDRWSLAEEIQKRAEKAGITVPVLVQVNAAGEDTKYGLTPSEVPDFIKDSSSLDRVRVKGLMTIAPFVENPGEARPVFKEMRRLFEEARQYDVPGVSMEWLSMGMTNDFEVAVEEGSNMVRIGSAIFGPRWS